MKKRFIIIGVALAFVAANYAANELTTTLQESYVKGYDALAKNITFISSVAGTNRYSANITVTNGGNTTVSFPNVTTPGILTGRNTSSSNTAGIVKLSVDGVNWLVGAAPGEPFRFRMATNVTSFVLSVSSTNTHQVELNILSN